MMLIKFDLVQTIAFACLLYILGLYVYNYFRLESSAKIPPVIIGGIIFVVARILLKGKIGFEFDFTFFVPSSTIFFTIIGFSISTSFFKTAKSEILRLLASAIGLLLLQDLLSFSLGKLLALPPLVSFMTGSVALTGGFGTVSAFISAIKPFVKTNGVMEIGIAFSSLGILFASLIGTPLAMKLIKKCNLNSASDTSEEREIISQPHFFGEKNSKITLESILMTFFQVCFIAGLAMRLHDYFTQKGYVMPSILIATVLAISLRCFCDKACKSHISHRLLHYFSNFNLMILIALAMMSIDIDYLMTLPWSLGIIFVSQLILAVAWCYLVTFKLLGSNYRGILAMTGHIGFGLGNTENALVNITNLSNNYEPDYKITFATVVVASFLIDVVNVFVLYIYYYNLIH